MVQGPAGGQVSELVWNLDLSSQVFSSQHLHCTMLEQRSWTPEGEGLTVRHFNMPNLRDFNAINLEVNHQGWSRVQRKSQLKASSGMPPGDG